MENILMTLKMVRNMAIGGEIVNRKSEQQEKL